MAVQVEAEFLDGRGRRVTAPAHRLVGEPLEERGAVWQPTAHRSRRAIATWWWSSTTGKLVGCASLERQRTAVELDFDRTVTGFSGWPVRLSWTRRDTQNQLVADFVARTADGARVLVVCPPSTPATRRNASSSSWGEVEEALREACAAAGWQLSLPRPGTAVRAANLHRAAQFRHPRHRDPASEEALLTAFARPRPLREGVAATGLPAAATLAQAYHLIWAQQLGFDWETPLLPTSIVTAAGVAR